MVQHIQSSLVVVKASDLHNSIMSWYSWLYSLVSYVNCHLPLTTHCIRTWSMVVYLQVYICLALETVPKWSVDYHVVAWCGSFSIVFSSVVTFAMLFDLTYILLLGYLLVSIQQDPVNCSPLPSTGYQFHRSLAVARDLH